MIDGESSKAEFVWRYDCSYSDAYLIKTSPDLTPKRFYNYTKRAFTEVKESNPSETEDMEKIVCDSKADYLDNSEALRIKYNTVGFRLKVPNDQIWIL